MDLPPAPRDTGLRNIIDKLAEFVARNGPEFEAITKAKQKGNPKFEFLYGGDYYNYYQYRMASEQSFLKQQASISQAQHHNQQQSPSSMSQLLPGQHPQQPPHTQHSQQMGFTSQSMTMNQPGMNQPPGMNPQTLWNNGPTTTNPSNNLTSQIETINIQQNTLRDQIRQSELNLSAQHGVLMQQQQKQIDEAITKAQNESVQKHAEDNNIRLAEFDAILQPIIESCTKDSISTGKNWILQHTSDTAKCNVVLQYLLKKALVNGSTFSQKLHLIYLVNDVLHHCVRKNANDLKSCLENVVIPMFCSADIIASDDQKGKLSKLLSLWESKAKFFDACVISKLRSPESSMQEYKTNLMNVHNNIVTQFTQATKAALDSYQQQHQVFIQHASQQIAMLESQKQTLEQQVLASVLPNTSLIPPLMDPQKLQSQTLNPSNGGINSQINSIQMQATNNIPIQANNLQMSGNNAQIAPNTPLMSTTQKPPPLMAQQVSLPSDGPYSNSSIGSPQSQHSNQNLYAVGLNNSSSSNSPYQQQSLMGYPQSFSQVIGNSNSDYTSPPPSFQIPDLSKPPPGFSSTVPQPPPPVIEEEVKPSAPYYELPAGLMVPLIRLEDYSYKPLDPEEIRIPPPAPQNERLSNAVVAFYSLPSHDRPRDVEGWEKLGLYEYYKVKNAAKKQKEEEIQSGVRDKSRSASPIVLEPTKPKKPNKRCYRSKSKSRSRSKSASISPRRSRTRSRSRSPERNRGGGTRYPANRRSPPRRSPIRERERERDRDRERDRGDRDRVKDRERERERERSVTPPSFFAGSYAKSNDFIEETNKGHQMLMKMGWGGSGTGLGPKNQGIDSPIPGGEVRDRKDMYKGVGININDPYENFRKNKGAAFIHRMRSRAEEKS